MKRCMKAGMIPMVCLALLAAGCRQQKQTETGKTYTADAPAKQGAGSGGEAGAAKGGDAQPLNAPADTTNGKASKSSDNGDSSATRGQVVAEPGAPVEHEAQHGPAKPPGGH